MGYFNGMLFRSGFWVLLLAASGVWVAGCRVAQPRDTPVRSPEPAVSGPRQEPAASDSSEEALTEAHAHYATGVIDELEGEPEQALREYFQAALEDPGDETLALEVSRRFLQANQWEKAMEVLARTAARSDASGALYSHLAFVYSKLGKTDLASKASRIAIKKDPRSLAGYENLFSSYLHNKQVQRALSVLDEAAGVPGTDAAFLIGLSELYSSLGLQIPDQKQAATARAVELLERAEGLNPEDPELRLKLADGFNLLGKDDEAARIYLAVLDSVPDWPLLREDIRSKLADLYLRSEKPKLAAEQLEAVVRENPTDARSYYALGSIAYDGKQFGKAAEYFSKVLLLEPEHERVYYELADSQISEDKNSQALETIDRARGKFPQSFFMEYLSGIACSGLKDYTNAFSHFNDAEVIAQARETNQLTREFYFQFGATCERKGDYPDAEKYFEKCIELSPDFSEALNYLGFMWADRGEKLDRARELIEKAVRLEPRNAAYLDSMGWVLFKLGQPKQALDCILKAIEYSEEEDPTLYDHLGDIYAALGQTDKAHAAWGKSLALEPNEQVRRKAGSAGK